MAYDAEKDPQIIAHKAAMAAPRAGFERAITLLFQGFEEYRLAHLARYDSSIGEDGVLGDEWAALGKALHGLLNGETGRLHCATLSTRIHAALREERKGETMETKASLSTITNRTDDQEAAREKLRALLPEGSTLHCVAKAVSRGNASTVIDFFLLHFEPCVECDGRGGTIARRRNESQYTGKACSKCNGLRGNVIPIWLSRMIYNAGIGRWDVKREAIRQGGHGEDRAGHIVRSLSRALYGREDALKREWL